MANSINWLFNCFLLLFNLHVAFLLFFYLWNVVLSSFCHALFSHSLALSSVCFILLSMCCLPLAHFPPSVHCPPVCTLATHSLSSLYVVSLCLGFSPKTVSKLPVQHIISLINMSFTINYNSSFNCLCML
jgi:hypothetical protein